MKGQELITFIESLPMFQKNTMDYTFDEIKLPEDARKFSNAFMPFKNFDDESLMTRIMAAITGRTQPYEPDAAVPLVPELPGWYYREWRGYEWRECMRFGEQVLRKIRNPDKPQEKWGQGLMALAQRALKVRMNNMIEWTAAQVILQGGFGIAEAGINYTYMPNVVPKYFYLDLAHGSGTPYSSGIGFSFIKAPWITETDDTRLWSDTTNSNCS